MPLLARRAIPRLRSFVATTGRPSTVHTISTASTTSVSASTAWTCAACRPSLGFRREHSTSSAAAQQTPSSPLALPSGYTRLRSRRILHLAGRDAPKYLQGAVTADVTDDRGNPSNHPFYAAFLTAQGRVRHDVFVFPGGPDTPDDAFYIDVDADEAERLVATTLRYRLRAGFDIRLLPEDEAAVWQAWDDTGTVGADAASADRIAELAGIAPRAVLADPRAPPGFGHRLLGLGGAMPVLDHLPLAAEDAYRVRRYLYGVPEGQTELPFDSALPLESNLDIMGGVDFRKGCYVGQELTIRTRHRGVVRKRVLPCAVYAADENPPDRLEYRPRTDGGPDAGVISPGASIGRVGKKSRSPGRWLAGVGNIGLALCRLETMTDIVLPGEVGGSAFDGADEFMVEGEGQDGQVRVKAFVPEWMRAGLEATNLRQ